MRWAFWRRPRAREAAPVRAWRTVTPLRPVTGMRPPVLVPVRRFPAVAGVRSLRRRLPALRHPPEAPAPVGHVTGLVAASYPLVPAEPAVESTVESVSRPALVRPRPPRRTLVSATEAHVAPPVEPDTPYRGVTEFERLTARYEEMGLENALASLGIGAGASSVAAPPPVAAPTAPPASSRRPNLGQSRRMGVGRRPAPVLALGEEVDGSGLDQRRPSPPPPPRADVPPPPPQRSDAPRTDVPAAGDSAEPAPVQEVVADALSRGEERAGRTELIDQDGPEHQVDPCPRPTPAAAPPITAPTVAAPRFAAPLFAPPPVASPPIAAPPVTPAPVTPAPVATSPIAAPPVTPEPITAPQITPPTFATPPSATPPVSGHRGETPTPTSEAPLPQRPLFAARPRPRTHRPLVPADDPLDAEVPGATRPQPSPPPPASETPPPPPEPVGPVYRASLANAPLPPEPSERDDASDWTTAPVPLTVVSLFRQELGVDVSQVPVHRGRAVSRNAAAIGARAYTRAGQVFIPDEAGDLDARPGRALLGHELAHAVQQRVLGRFAPAEESADGKALEHAAVNVERWLEGGPRPATLLHRPLHDAVQVAEPRSFTDAEIADILQRATAPEPIPHQSWTPATGFTQPEPAPPSPAPQGPAPQGPAPEGPAPNLVADTRPADGLAVVFQEIAGLRAAVAELRAEPEPARALRFDDLAGRLYHHVRSRLRAELIVDRERAGVLADSA